MRDIYEVIIALVLVAIIVWIVVYSFSWAITSFLGKETLMVIVFGLALFLLFKDILKRFRKKKDE